MAVRVTEAEVLAILGTSTDYNFVLTPFITSANTLVNNYLSNKGLTEAVLTEIEKWTAAHLVSCRMPPLNYQRVGAAEERYTLATSGVGLMSTSYGQTAVSLDTTGTLVRITNGRAMIKHMGVSERP